MMPLPRVVARANRYVTNPVARRFAGRIAPFAIVEHRGRTSGRVYQTPIAVFQASKAMIFALTYGPTTDWVKNVIAAGGCRIEYKGDWILLTAPALTRGDPSDQPFPRIVRMILGVIGVSDFLTMERKHAGQSRPSDSSLTES